MNDHRPTMVDVRRLYQLAQQRRRLARAAILELPEGDPRREAAAQTAIVAGAVITNLKAAMAAVSALIDGPGLTIAADHDPAPVTDASGPTDGRGGK